MIEIDLKINGETIFEYYTNSVPRIGEYINISHDEISGEYVVERVTHRIFQERKNKEVITYVIVEVKGI